MGRRITRAKSKIKAARIPYRVPVAEDLPARVSRCPGGALPDLQRGLSRLGPGSRSPSAATSRGEAIRLTRLLRTCCRRTARWPACWR